MTYGIYGTYLLNRQLEMYGTLPDIPHGYSLFQVTCKEDIKNIRNMMSFRNAEIDAKYPEESSGKVAHLGSCPYDDECFLVALWFTTIFDYWFGKNNKYEYFFTMELESSFDILQMSIWEWIRDEISTKKLKEYALDFYNKVMKYNK